MGYGEASLPRHTLIYSVSSIFPCVGKDAGDTEIASLV